MYFSLWPVLSTVVSSAAAALFSWLFKLSIEKALDLKLHRDLERYKSELQLQSQQQVERLKAELQLQSQQQVEQLRSELNARNEVIRHEMQKQMLRAQLSTTKTHEVYSQLIKLIRQAEGAVGALWGMRRVPTYEKYSADDIKRVLEEANAPDGEEREILEQLKSDRARAIKHLRDVLRRKEMHDALKAHVEAKNHIILEGIFMTRLVRDLAFKVCKSLGEAYVAVEVGTEDPSARKFHEDYTRLCDQATEDIGQLEEAMRADLLPGFVEPRL